MSQTWHTCKPFFTPSVLQVWYTVYHRQDIPCSIGVICRLHLGIADMTHRSSQTGLALQHGCKLLFTPRCRRYDTPRSAADISSLCSAVFCIFMQYSISLIAIFLINEFLFLPLFFLVQQGLLLLLPYTKKRCISFDTPLLFGNYQREMFYFSDMVIFCMAASANWVVTILS